MTIHDELRPLCAAAPRDVNIYDDVGWRCPEAEAFYARIHETLPALLDENARLRAARRELETAVAWIEDLAVFSQTDPSAPTKAELLRQLRAALEAANA
jgi:hypothetical protein